VEEKNKIDVQEQHDTEKIKEIKKEIPKTETKILKQGTLDFFNIKIQNQNVIDQKAAIIDMSDDIKLKIISWNVNGLRSLKGKGTLDELIKNGI